MRKRLAIAVAVLVFAALVATVWHSRPPPEPVYQGRPLSDWLDDYIHAVPVGYSAYAAAEAAQRPARTAVRTIGTNAIPFLLDMVRRPDDSRLRLLLRKANSMIHGRFHIPSAWQVRNEGIAGFKALGAEASNAVPALIQIHEENPAFRYPVACCLGAIGPPAEDSIPILLSDITNSDGGTRYWAAYALGQIHSRPEIVVPALTNALVHESTPGIVMDYFDVLATYGPTAKSAVPVLRAYLNGQTNEASASMDAGSQRMAAAWIQKIDPQSAAK
jgi:HEAT repeat protein